MPGTGVGSAGNKSGFVTVHGGMMTLDVSWAAVRTGTPPVLQSYFATDPNVIPLGGAITLENVDVAADGVSPIYAVGGSYQYGVVDPSLASVTAAIPPFLSTTMAQAGPLAAGFSSDSVLWRFQASTGANPFCCCEG